MRAGAVGRFEVWNHIERRLVDLRTADERKVLAQHTSLDSNPARAAGMTVASVLLYAGHPVFFAGLGVEVVACDELPTAALEKPVAEIQGPPERDMVTRAIHAGPLSA